MLVSMLCSHFLSFWFGHDPLHLLCNLTHLWLRSRDGRGGWEKISLITSANTKGWQSRFAWLIRTPNLSGGRLYRRWGTVPSNVSGGRRGTSAREPRGTWQRPRTNRHWRVKSGRDCESCKPRQKTVARHIFVQFEPELYRLPQSVPQSQLPCRGGPRWWVFALALRPSSPVMQHTR